MTEQVLLPHELAARIIHSFFQITDELIKQRACRQGSISDDDYDRLVNRIKKGEYIDLRNQPADVRRTFNCIRSLWTCEALPQRLSNFLSLTVQEGIESALIFYASKADRNLYEMLYNMLVSALNNNINGAINALGGANSAAEKLSRECRDAYTLSLAMVVVGLTELHVFGSCSGLGTMPGLIEHIRQAIVNKSFNRYHELIVDFLVNLKRFADAMYK